MNIGELLVRSPINRTARAVTSQKWCVDDRPLSRDDLLTIKARLDRKLRLLKHVLRIKTRAQHVGVRHKANRGIPQFRQIKEPRAFQEYARVGQELQRLQGELSIINRVRKVGAMIAGTRPIDVAIIESTKRELMTRAAQQIGGAP